MRSLLLCSRALDLRESGIVVARAFVVGVWLLLAGLALAVVVAVWNGTREWRTRRARSGSRTVAPYELMRRCRPSFAQFLMTRLEPWN